jgi:uncharacterized OB-fold protein
MSLSTLSDEVLTVPKHGTLVHSRCASCGSHTRARPGRYCYCRRCQARSRQSDLTEWDDVGSSE